jgi:nucleoside 2-deoxyribosyltransferase
MNKQGKDKPFAFVLMPFQEEFNEVYAQLIKGPFESAGFEVFRADDFDHQQSILKDIVVSIAKANVIVADLTYSNPNVYYELGLAHAMKKAVVLMTQDIDSLPFDLKSYRHIEYSVHFADFQKAHKAVTELAVKIFNKEIAFGNPVSDFIGYGFNLFQGASSLETSSAISAEAVLESASDGVVDAMINFNECFEGLSDLVVEFGELTEKVGSLATDATPELEKSTNSGDLKRARSILRKLATEYEKHVNDLKEINISFKGQLIAVGNSFEIILNHLQEIQNKKPEEGEEFLTNMHTMNSQSQSAKNSIKELTDSMRAIPKLERGFDTAKMRLIEEFEEFMTSISLIAAMLSRTEGVTINSEIGSDNA